MNFIDRLFPFLNKEVFNENILTSYWVIALMAIFLIAILYLLVNLFQIRKSIKIDKLPKNKNLGKIWEAYQATFSEYGNTRKTTEYSENFFNEQNILYASLNLRAVNNVSNTLIGLGILGTFVGLTYGIADSNFETTEAIKNSINNLLSGMGTAFVSSIWGMGLSLIFTNIFKIWQSNLTRSIQNICLELDSKNKIKQQELEKVQQENQRKIINELFNEYLVADTDEGKQLPKNVFRQLLEESVKQTASLQTFSDDLGESIELAMEKLVEDNNQQINKLIEEKLVPVLEDLKEIKQDSGTQVIEDAVQRLADSMKAMMEDFKKSITGDTKQEMENVTDILTVVSNSLESVPAKMEDIILQVDEMIKTLNDTVKSTIVNSETSNQKNIENAKELFGQATSENNESIKNLQSHLEMLLSNQKDNIKEVSKITFEFQNILKDNRAANVQFDSMIQKSKIVANLIDSISNKFENSSSSIGDASSALLASTSKFDIGIKTYLDKNEEILKHQDETLQKSLLVVESYSERFETIETGLSGIFDQIQTGLKEYQKTTASNLNQYLTEFSTTLTAAHQGLENNVSVLHEITEELTEQIEKMVDRK